MDLALNNLQGLIYQKTQQIKPNQPMYGPNRNKLCTYAKLNCLKWNHFVCYTELFEMECFDI